MVNLGEKWSQRQIASKLYLSQSEIHAALKRLMEAGLLRASLEENELPQPIISAAEEYLIHGLKYSFPATPGEYTPGVPTGIAAPVFEKKLFLEMTLLRCGLMRRAKQKVCQSSPSIKRFHYLLVNIQIKIFMISWP